MTEECTCGFCGGPLPCLTHSVGKEDIAMTAINAYIDGWNAAIEAAALAIAPHRTSEYAVRQIRKLKK